MPTAKSAYRFTIQVRGGSAQDVGSVYCIGRNYAEHAAELKNAVPSEPVVFLKTTSALRNLSEGPLAFTDETFHHEVEVVLLIGEGVPLGAQGSWKHVSALGLGLDLTRRDVQTALKTKGLPWTTAKSFAGSGVLTEFLPLASFSQPEKTAFKLTVNNEERQQGDLGSLIFSVPTLLSFLAQHVPLYPGDLVYTGTPKGVGPVRKGDRLRLEFLDPATAFTGVL